MAIATPWRAMALNETLELVEARALLDGAARADDVSVDADQRSTTFWVWSGPRDLQGRRRLGSVSRLWRRPTPGQATFHQVVWNPARGAPGDVWRAFERRRDAAAVR